ncbi:hypothetical protein A5784_25395 [Mycobacterium sp. 852013-50091_SCH5140682]|uniref:serine hydrolase domain-containing protein n=1 Tax=Mycobacterium sp. 852013-50091_SCH5140682 TaxID=1834109 RepID=UPI0007EB2F58|nr:serine hydrolase domain-containing protein [Mycobacterium sp. 852013-50091_SCH5140682]OBC16869.1 hypothetical protein A5784_25395 [Mycobacterium sp. 852013-50091_SCH5140682]
MPADGQSTLQSLVAGRVMSETVPGAVYVVFTADGPAFSGSAGIAGVDGRSPCPDTAFRIASCTKSFTAAAVLRLRDAGRLSLDDPVARFIDIGPCELPGAQTVQQAVTVGALLNMSGGFASDNPWADRQESMSEDEFTALCRRGFTLTGAPGTRYEYSNLGYALLGRVIRQASGMEYRQYVTDNLLRPLGLSHSAFDAAQCTAPGGVTVGFHRVGHQWRPAAVSTPGAFSSIGGLYMTANELAAWCRWLAAGYPWGAIGDDILAASSRREMQQLHQLDPARATGPVRVGGYGYGLDVELHDCGVVVSHRGGYPGFSAQMAWHPETQLGVVILENASYARTPAVTALRHLLAAAGLPTRPEPWPATIAARDEMERLFARWDDAVADRLFADNVDLDMPRQQRCSEIASAALAIGFSEERRHRSLALCEPISTSPANLEWTVRGLHGELRCEITLTSVNPPKVQSITLSSKGSDCQQDRGAAGDNSVGFAIND